jgi:hypothetical protein
MQALAGEKRAKMLGESDERGSYISRETLHSQESKAEKAFKGL